MVAPLLVDADKLGEISALQYAEADHRKMAGLGPFGVLDWRHASCGFGARLRVYGTRTKTAALSPHAEA